MLRKYKFFINESDEFDPLDDILEEEKTKDSITFSIRFENRLKELKINTTKKIEVGDKIFLKDDRKGKLDDKIYDFLKSKHAFEVLRMNDKGKLDLGYADRYIREDGKKIKKVFFFSPRRFEKVDTLDPVAQFLLSLKEVNKSHLMNNPIDYLDIDEKGNISFLSRRYVDEGGDPFKSKKRQTAKFNKIVNRIVTKEYYDEYLNPRNIEIFLNKWRVMFDTDLTIELLSGDDILEAFNYTNNCETSWVGSSCANFRGSSNRNTDRFKVYTENSQIKCLIVRKQGKVMGRRIYMEGVQTVTHGKFKEGATYKYLNNFFGHGGGQGKVDQVMVRWAKDNDVHITSTDRDIFRIKIDESCFKLYPPFDFFYVNFDTNELASRMIKPENQSGGYSGGMAPGWRRTYSASCKK